MVRIGDVLPDIQGRGGRQATSSSLIGNNAAGSAFAALNGHSTQLPEAVACPVEAFASSNLVIFETSSR